MNKNKVKCGECSWKGENREILESPNPFDTEEQIQGCPQCKSVDSICTICDEDNCWDEVSCGTSTPDGYRNTCSDHYFKIKNEEKNK